MKKILVPTDFSDNAFKAIAYAAEIARKSNATVHIMHVIEPSLNMATMQTDSSNKKVLKNRSDKLNLTIKSIRAVYPGLKLKSFLFGGKVIDSILEYAQSNKINLIVMGTKGASGLKKVFVGSVTAGTISKSTVPVLTVPVSYEVEEPDVILFATNLFEKNKSLLKKIVAIPKLLSASVHVVVFKDVEGDKNADLIYNDEQLHNYLHFLKETFPGIDFKGSVVEGEDFELAMDGYCADHEGDMITMVTYPKSFFEKLFQKSMTKKMAFHSTIPILAVPANT